MEHQSTSPIRSPLVKFIWMKLKSIYQTELKLQLAESRKKITECYLQIESMINIKSHRNESIITLDSFSLFNFVSYLSILDQQQRQISPIN